MLKELKFDTLTQAYKQLNFSYLGDVNTSAKLKKGEKMNVDTYGVYLAPSNVSGYQVCSHDKHCKEHCLFYSGRNKIEKLMECNDKERITPARIKKTKLLFENKDYFMQMLIAEIEKKQIQAYQKGNYFAVRLNCTSDLRLDKLVYNGQNILDIFSNVQFYDYTKNPKNIELVKKYTNFHLTFSYSGFNWNDCKKALDNNVNVAVVFDSPNLPKTFNGYEVINGDETDYRPSDKKGVIVGLKFKKPSTCYDDMHKFKMPDTPFVVKVTDKRCA